MRPIALVSHDPSPKVDGPVASLAHENPVAVAALLGEFDTGVLASVRAGRASFATGFDPLDRVLNGGFRVHDLVVLAGRPGVGKTVATLQWARNLAMGGAKVVYACYEHDEHTLLARLMAMEIGSLGLGAGTGSPLAAAEVINEVMAGRWTMATPTGRHPIVRAARAQLDTYADRLVLIAASPSRTDARALSTALEDRAEDPSVLFVDHLQKMKTGDELKSRSEHMMSAVGSLKEIALAHNVAVVSISGVGGAALTARRLRLHHLEEPAIVGYEADVVIVMNDKRLAVSRVHLTHDTAQAERLARMVVFSVEKNRGGPALVDVEFEKDFLHYRFNPAGSFVQERLIDELNYSE